MEPAAMSTLWVVGLVITVGILLTLLVLTNKKMLNNNAEIKSIKNICDTFMNGRETVIYLKDEQLNYIFINKAAEPHFQEKVPQIMGRIDPDRDIEALGSSIIATNRIIEYEEKHKNRIYKVKKFPVELRNHRIGVGAFIREITDEEKLIKKQERILFRNKILVNVLSKNFP